MVNIDPMVAHSPAAFRTPVAGTRLRELPWCGKINLRGTQNDPKFLQAVEQSVGCSLPLQANSTMCTNNIVIFWLGPDEWLLHCELAHTAKLMHTLQQELQPTHHALTEVTDYYTVLELQGRHARAALARGTPLDVHERSFAINQCMQSRFGNASVLLYRPPAGQSDTEPGFQIQVRWSFTEYVWSYLTTAIDAMQSIDD